MNADPDVLSDIPNPNSYRNTDLLLYRVLPDSIIPIHIGIPVYWYSPTSNYLKRYTFVITCRRISTLMRTGRNLVKAENDDVICKTLRWFPWYPYPCTYTYTMHGNLNLSYKFIWRNIFQKYENTFTIKFDLTMNPFLILDHYLTTNKQII